MNDFQPATALNKAQRRLAERSKLKSSFPLLSNGNTIHPSPPDTTASEEKAFTESLTKENLIK